MSWLSSVLNRKKLAEGAERTQLTLDQLAEAKAMARATPGQDAFSRPRFEPQPDGRVLRIRVVVALLNGGEV